MTISSGTGHKILADASAGEATVNVTARDPETDDPAVLNVAEGATFTLEVSGSNNGTISVDLDELTLAKDSTLTVTRGTGTDTIKLAADVMNIGTALTTGTTGDALNEIGKAGAVVTLTEGGVVTNNANGTVKANIITVENGAAFVQQTGAFDMAIDGSATAKAGDQTMTVKDGGLFVVSGAFAISAGDTIRIEGAKGLQSKTDGAITFTNNTSRLEITSGALDSFLKADDAAKFTGVFANDNADDEAGKITLGAGSVVFLDEELNYKDIDSLVSDSADAGKIYSQASDTGSLVFSNLTVDQATTNSANVNLVAGDLTLGAASIANNSITFDSITVKNSLKAVAYNDNNPGTADYRDIADLVLTRDDGETGTVTGPVNVTGTFAASEGVWEVESLKIASTATSAAVSAAADKTVRVTVGNLDLDADFSVGNASDASTSELAVGTLDIANGKTLTVQQTGAGTGVLDLTEAQLVNDTSKAPGSVKGTIKTAGKGVVRITGETLSAAIADTAGDSDTAANKGYKFDIAANGTLEVTEGDITLNAADLVGTGLTDSGIQLAANADFKAENSTLTLKSTVNGANQTTVGSVGVSGAVSVKSLVIAAEEAQGSNIAAANAAYTLATGEWTVADGLSVTKNGTADSSIAVNVGGGAAEATLKLNAANEANHTVANDIVLGHTDSELTVDNGNWTLADVDASKGTFTVEVGDFGGEVSVKDLTAAANTVVVNGDDLKVTGTLTATAGNSVKINDGGSLEVAKLALKGASANAGVIAASDGSTVTVSASDVLKKDGTAYKANADTYVAGAIKTDGTSVLNLSGLNAITGGDVTAAEFAAIKTEVLGNAAGGLSLGVGISDLGTGTDIAYEGAEPNDVDAVMLAGNADALVNRRVTGVPVTAITTANFWGSAQLASGVSALNIDTGSVSLKNAATNNGMFVSTSDNKLAGVNFSSGGTVLFRGNGSVGAIDTASAGDGTAIFQAGTIDVQGKFGGTAALGTVEVQDDAVVSSWGGRVNNLNVYGTLTVSQDADKTAGTGDLTVSTAFDLDGGSLTVSGDLDVSAVTETEGAGTINVGGDFKVGDFKLTDTSYVNVGALEIIDGKTFINDPAWTSGPSVVVADDVKTAADAGTLGGNWVTGQNSLSYLGEDEAGAGVQALAASLSETGVKARFVLDKSLTVGDSTSADKLVVDGDVTADSWNASSYTGNGVYVQNGAELIITRNAFGENGDDTAITLANTTSNAVTVDDTSKIVLKGVEVVNGKEYHLFSGTSITYTGVEDAIDLANGLFSGTFANGVYTIAYDQAKADATLAQTDSSIKNMLETYAQRTDNTGVFDVEADGAVGFVSRAVELGNAASVGRSLDSAAQFVTAGGVPQVSLMAQKAGVSAIETRMGFNGAVASAIGEVQGTNATVWVTPLYSSFESDSFDMGAQEGGVDADLFGVAVGSDFMVADALRLGVAFNVGSGDSDSEGDLASTSNDFEFLGANLYGGYEYGALAIMADLGYTMVSSDIDQSNAAGALSADIDSTVFSVGVQGKYVFDVSGFDIAPHLGVRYTRVDIEDYTVSGVLDGDSVDQSLVTFPVGVTFSKDIVAGNWDVKPVLDLSVIPAAGDTDVDVDSTFINMGDVSVNSEIVDSVSFGGKLGVEAEYGSFGLGLSYQYLGSSNVDSHNVMGNVRYSF